MKTRQQSLLKFVAAGSALGSLAPPRTPFSASLLLPVAQQQSHPWFCLCVDSRGTWGLVDIQLSP